MGLEDFQGATSTENASTAMSEAAAARGEEIGEELEGIISKCFDDLDSHNGKSFHYEDDKVVADRDELIKDVMLMCAMAVKEVNS